jgi:hypothetical protein
MHEQVDHGQPKPFLVLIESVNEQADADFDICESNYVQQGRLKVAD